MMNRKNLLYQHRYRIPSARANWWDYSRAARYFITVCSAGRVRLFGDVTDKKFHPSAIGGIVLEEWERSFSIRRELFCDAFVLMPDHLHAIVRIENLIDVDGAVVDPSVVDPSVVDRSVVDPSVVDWSVVDPSVVETSVVDWSVVDPSVVETSGRTSLPMPKSKKNETIARIAPKSISSFMAGFKSASTKRINEYRDMPRMQVWQTRFHDRIIRDEHEFQCKRRYIQNNPAKWDRNRNMK